MPYNEKKNLLKIYKIDCCALSDPFQILSNQFSISRNQLDCKSSEKDFQLHTNYSFSKDKYFTHSFQKCQKYRFQALSVLPTLHCFEHQFKNFNEKLQFEFYQSRIHPKYGLLTFWCCNFKEILLITFTYKGSPTYAVFTTADPTNTVFGLCKRKWGIFALVGDT